MNRRFIFVDYYYYYLYSAILNIRHENTETRECRFNGLEKGLLFNFVTRTKQLGNVLTECETDREIGRPM